jgi:tetratricopeptide (TPR) repeat protein
MTRRHVPITFSDDVNAPAAPDDVDLFTSMSMRGVWTLWAALLLGCILIGYVPSLTAGFIFGDDANLTANAAIRSWSGLWAIWRLPHTFPQFSPVGYTTFLLEYRFWGLLAKRAAGGYHAINILVHCINAILLWTLGRRLKLRGAWIAAALFGLHPLAVQSVSWISQRPALLGLLFSLSAILVYLRYCGLDQPPIQFGRNWLRLPQRPWMLYALSLILFLAAVLSDPAMATLPLALLTLIWWKRGSILRGDVRSLLPFLFISLLAPIGAVLVMNRSLPASSEPVLDLWPSLSPTQRLLGTGRAVLFYTAKVFWPTHLAFAYARWELHPASVLPWIGLVLIPAALALAWRYRGSIGRGPAAAVVLFFLSILPGITFVTPSTLRGAFVADSVAYPALAVVSLAIVSVCAAWLQSLAISNRFALPGIAGAVVVAVLGVMTMLDQPAYRKTDLLWADAVAKIPNSTYALNRLGELELERKHITPAEDRFRQALTINPGDLAAVVNLGRVFEARGEWDKAISQYYLAQRSGAREIDVHFWLANAFAGQGNSREAVRQYQLVLQQNPNYDRAYNNLGLLYYQRGEYERAEEQFHKALRVNPRLVIARINLASTYFITGRGKEAETEIIAAWQIEPNNAQILMNVGSILGTISESASAQEMPRLLSAAEEKFRQAIGVDSQFAEAWNNLGIVLARQAQHDSRARGKLREAVYAFGRAAELEPENQRYRMNFESAKRQSGTN